MTTHPKSSRPAEPLDELTTQLLACGAVLSQIVSHMIRTQAAGRAAPDAAPIPEAAHAMIRDVLGDLAKRSSPAEIGRAAAIVADAARAIADNVILVPVDFN